MWIKALRTKGFGILGTREFQFSKGLNLIYGPNETGKTTLFDALTKALLLNPALPRAYGGECEVLIVDQGGEKWFKRGVLKLTTKHFENLYLVRTGELQMENSRAFLKEFKAKLLNIDRLYKAREEIEKQLGDWLPSKRVKGELIRKKEELERELQILKEKRDLLKENPRDLLRLKELEKEEKALTEKLKEIEEKEKRFKKAWEKKTIRQRLEFLLTEKSKREKLEKLLEEVKKLEGFTRQRLLDLKELENQRENLLKNYHAEKEALKGHEEKLKEKERRLKEKEDLLNELFRQSENLIAQRERIEKGLKKLGFQKHLGNLLLFVSLLALGAFLFTFKPLIIPAVGFPFVLWLFLRVKFTQKEKKLREEEESLKDQRIRNDERLKNYQKEIEALQGEIRDLEREVLQKESLLKNLEKRQREREEELRNMLSMFGISSLFEFEEKVRIREELELEISLLKKEGLRPQEEIDREERELVLRLKELEDVPIEVEEGREIETQKRCLKEELEKCLREISEIKGRISERGKIMGIREEVLYMRIEELKEEFEELKRKIEDHMEVYRLFEELERRLDKELIEILQGRTKEWFSQVVGERVNKLAFKGGDLEVILDGMLLKEKQLSASTRDSLYLSARLALIEKSPYPLRTVLLDDPFVTCDPERTAKLFEVIDKFSENFQVIIATKDPFLKEEALKRGAHIIELEKANL